VRLDIPNILLVNPWIHDFAAYDFWAKPLGLLYIAAILKAQGFSVSYIDCLDRFHAKSPSSGSKSKYGKGPYLKTPIEKPKLLSAIPRNFSRYGIKDYWFEADLKSLPVPDLVLITSMMIYWYPGVQETIRKIREIFPKVPILLGGIYATLCPEHAIKYSGADSVITGAGEEQILKIVEDYTGFSPESSHGFEPDNLDTYPYPAFYMQNKINYVPLLTSRGCPFSCAYCASAFLMPKRILRSAESVIKEIEFWHKKYKILDFVLYDDAFLVDAQKHAIPILEGIIKTGYKLRFHTPNAVHIRKISKKTAKLMHKAGFTTLRLGLETGIFESRETMDSKVTKEEFTNAVKCLSGAGFGTKQIGAYLLAGLPQQEVESVALSIKMVKQHKITPIIAYYTPIPHTDLWDTANFFSRYDLKSDPIFTNNAILPCMGKEFTWATVSYLKNLAKI